MVNALFSFKLFKKNKLFLNLIKKNKFLLKIKLLKFENNLRHFKLN